MIYQIVIPGVTSKSVKFPAGLEKHMVEFLRKKGLHGSIYLCGTNKKVATF